MLVALHLALGYHGYKLRLLKGEDSVPRAHVSRMFVRFLGESCSALPGTMTTGVPQLCFVLWFPERLKAPALVLNTAGDYELCWSIKVQLSPRAAVA